MAASDSTPGPACPIAVAGGGSIGTAFTLLFAAAGQQVRVYDADTQQLSRLRGQIAAIAAELRAFGLLSASDEFLQQHIELHAELATAVANVGYVQECAPEQLELKRDLFRRLDRLAPATAILASASSAIPMSRIAGTLPGAHRCLIAHPGNPPFLIRLIELVPAAFTAPAVVERAHALLAAVGLAPIRVRKEVVGFVFNRLQGALLREAYCLVRDGVTDVEAIDRIVRDGLGLRWSVVGPFETVDLNTRGGIASHAHTLGPAYAAMGAERGQNDPWTPDLVAKVTEQRRRLLPLEQWEARVAWRDRALMALIAARMRSVDPSD